MQRLIIPPFAIAFAVGLASTADAGHHHRRHVRAHHAYSYDRPVAHRHYRNDSNDDTLGGYYEHRLEAVRFGSQRWWYIYDEQRGGRRR
jgi:hypothetical protein